MVIFSFGVNVVYSLGIDRHKTVADSVWAGRSGRCLGFVSGQQKFQRCVFIPVYCLRFLNGETSIYPALNSAFQDLYVGKTHIMQ